MQSLAQKEARNFEFDFLRPTHSLFGYFNGLVEQYSKVLLPSKDMLAKLQRGTEEGTRWKMLEISKQHAEWERLKREKEKKKENDREAEKSAYVLLFIMRLVLIFEYSRLRGDRLARLRDCANNRVYRSGCKFRASSTYEHTGNDW